MEPTDKAASLIPTLQSLAKEAAGKYALDPALVCAIIEQESSWNPWAIRYEPAFYVHYVMPQRNLSATEAYARAFSWGLMQIMGEVAREEGFPGDLPSLCDPAIGLDAGCNHFKRKLVQANNDVAHALQLWNGGGNPQYFTQVLARVAKYRTP
jgi:soluble lytic murein transglycosylase-like protein